MPELKNPPKRIVILKPSALGDIAHSLPVLSALRQLFPAAHLAWVVNRAYAPILEQHPDLDEIIQFDRAAMRKNFFTGMWQFAHFLYHLRQQRFDLAIDLQGLFRTGAMTLATGAPTRIGLASAREGARYCYTHRIVDDIHTTHAVDRYWRVIESLVAARFHLADSIRQDGILPPRSHEKTFHVPIDADARAWALEQLQSYPRPWLAVGVGSRWLTKRWPPQHFASLVSRALAQFGGTVIFVGTPDEADLAAQAASLVAGRALQLTGKTSLPQLVALLSLADVMIANDTGPLHLAVALGRPVVAPFTCTSIARTGPYAQSDRAVSTTIWCRGSYLKTCARMECMQELTPEKLWPPLESILRDLERRLHAA